MNIKQAVQDIKNLLIEAGDFARAKQKGIKTQYKDGEQALTEADLAVSKMVAERLASWMALDNHVLIDEENITLTPKEAFEKSEYIWAIDPIDGTAGYALGRRLWGVSLALLHQGQPVAGGIYLPGIKELLLSDGNKTTLFDLDVGTEEILTIRKMDVNTQIFVESYYGNGRGWGNTWGDCPVWKNTPESAVQGFTSALKNQAAGAVLTRGFSLWDVAAAFVMAKTTGHKIFSMEDGRELVTFTADDFHDNWKLKEDWLLCHAENFEFIKNALTQ